MVNIKKLLNPEVLKNGVLINIFSSKAVIKVNNHDISVWSFLGIFFYFLFRIYKFEEIVIGIIYVPIYFILFIILIHYFYQLMGGNLEIYSLFKILPFVYFFDVILFLINLVFSQNIIINEIISYYPIIVMIWLFSNLYKVKLWKSVIAYLFTGISMLIFSDLFRSLIIL